MIPILYDSTEALFDSNGLGRLRDCITCTVTEERNGIYECDFTYPVDGAHFNDIIPGRIVAVRHDETDDIQPFDIVGYSRPINGIASFHAVHISYRLTGYTTGGIGVNSLSAALAILNNDTKPTSPFSFRADYTSTGYMSAMDGTPRSVRQMMGGIEGSVLDAYGGEYEFDKFDIILHRARGEKRDFMIRYGVNLIDYKEDADFTGTYSSCVPYWSGGDGGVIVIGNKVNSGLQTYNGLDICIPLDLSSKFENKPTKTQLQNLAASMMASKQVNLPSQSISVDFVRLQDLGYEDLAPLLDCKLCDTINVVFPQYNMTGAFKIVKTVWNALAGRYDSMELGNLSTSLSEALGINQEGQSRVIDGLINVNSDGAVEVNADLNVIGGITVGNHEQQIGYMPAGMDEQTASIATGTDLKDTSIGFTLDPGKWVLVASVRFPTSATGYRGVAWGYGSTDMLSTRVRSNNLGSSYYLDLQTVAIVSPSTQRTYTVRAFQTTGSAMTVTVNARAIRIE